MRLRTLATAALVVVVSLSTAGPTLAKPGGERGGDKAADAGRPAKAARADAPAKAQVQAGEEAKAAKAAKPAKPRKAAKTEAQARRKARFVAVGAVTAVSGDSVTLLVKGGSARSLRGKTQAFTVASGASVRRNGQVVAVSAIKAGDHAMVKGVKAGDIYTAHKVRAQSRRSKSPTSSSSTTSTSSTSTTTP